jgi:hypothetical protein
MNALKMIAGLALACMTTGSFAQCSGHAKEGAKADMGNAGMSMLTKELGLSADQQTAVTAALNACEKDCSDMASASTEMTTEDMAAKKQARFASAVEAMKTSLNPEQVAKLDALNKSGKLNSLCAANGKGCCAGKSAKAACCADKAKSAGLQERKPATKGEGTVAPTMQ